VVKEVQGFCAMGSEFSHLPGLAARASVRAEKVTFGCNFFLIPGSVRSLDWRVKHK